MPLNSGGFEGRRGQKRLREIENQIEAFRAEINCAYDDTPEMIFLQEQVLWEERAKLHFTIALKDVHTQWDAVRDYGFIRLSVKWIKDRKQQAVMQGDVIAMVKDILPAAFAEEIEEEIDALEIY
ncbi:MAG: hypothetical protein GX663_04720 [Clostridiales bacterium]|nr:hypothetical protein [Clostridiales bacterium]